MIISVIRRVVLGIGWCGVCDEYLGNGSCEDCVAHREGR